MFMGIFRALISAQTALGPDGSPILDAFSWICRSLRLGGLDAWDACQKSYCTRSNFCTHPHTTSNPRQVVYTWISVKVQYNWLRQQNMVGEQWPPFNRV